MLLWPRDDFAGAAQLLGEAETVARAAGDAGVLAWVRQHQGYVALYRGDLDLAVARGEECLATCTAIPHGFGCHGALWLLARTTLARGEDERATDLYERLLASARAGGDAISIGNGHEGLAVLAARRGELGPALAGFAAAAAGLHDVGQPWMACGCLAEAAATAVGLGRLEPAARLFAALDALRTAMGAAGVSAFVLDHERHEQALATARAALGTDRFAAAWAAGLALSFDEAIAVATTLAQQVNSPDPALAAAASTDDAWAEEVGLSSREREVLALLMTGRSDKEIAEALYVARPTASKHVASILAKLDVASRAAAVAVALRHGGR
jgi:non-specific serine/threonine protein kinase